MKNLSYKNRQRFFWLLVLVFLIALPSLIFYTTGYRISFEDDETTIVTTGGIYVTTDNLEVDVYLDEEQVERPRLFRSAYYIQNIEAGQHRVVVQSPGLHTWVKELPVDSHIVIEAAAFNMPVVPQVRPITEYVTATGTPVVFASPTVSGATSTALQPWLEHASVTVPYFFATSSATSTFEQNEEFIYVESLFSTTSTSTRSVFERILDEVERFRFATTSPMNASNTMNEVEMVERGDTRIIQRNNELYAVWTGSNNAIPYYYCVTDASATTTARRYGEHVAEAIERIRRSSTTDLIIAENRICRPEIKLDRLRQDVYFSDFFPNSSDLILLQLEDGLYVTEIDDRAWQNTQRLYPGTDFRTVVENDVIYIEDGGRFFEVVPEIELDE